MRLSGLAHGAYRLLMRALAGPLLAWLWWRGRKDPGYRIGLGQRLGRIEPRPASIGGILIHAASVGEVQAARPLIDALRAEWPLHTLTVSTQSPTGARQLRSHWGDTIQHLFFPVDTPGATARFLDRLRPQLVVLMERELWPEMLRQCRERAIPVALVNARLSARSAVQYRRWAALMQPVWAQLALVAAADRPSHDRLSRLGVAPARLMESGNLKFDQAATPASMDELPWLSSRKVLVAGSTHEGEEAALLAVWPTFAQRHPDSLLILVPRHPERFDSVAQELDAAGLTYARRSAAQEPWPTTTVLLADTMGELELWYRHASVCFIGGSLTPIGGHNALEALACGKPVLFGPHTQHFQSLYHDIEASGVGQRIDSAQALLALTEQWLDDASLLSDISRRAREFVTQQQGSSARTVAALRPLWQPIDPARLSRVAEQKEAQASVWLDPDLITSDAQDLFEPASTATSLATGSGRGQAHRMERDGLDLVLRHYRRGGLMARFSPDRYWRERPQDSRAMAEYSLLRRMQAWHLPVPAPVAARYRREGRWWYSADILVRMIPGTQNVAERLSAGVLSDAEWQALGRAIRRLHERQVFHADLNCHNLLLGLDGSAWIVDFDKCAVRRGDDWKSQNLERLRRSLRKEQVRRQPFHWAEDRWSVLLRAYAQALGEAPPPVDAEGRY